MLAAGMLTVQMDPVGRPLAGCNVRVLDDAEAVIVTACPPHCSPNVPVTAIGSL